MNTVSLYQFGGLERHALQLQKRFVETFRNAPGPVVDLGCGKGAFISALRAAGIQSLGVDPATESVETCRSKGFEIVQTDALSYLASHPTHYGGILLSHVIEHFPPDKVEEFFSLARGSLVRGGKLVVVTPNVADLWTMTEAFWLDLTHIRPYPLPLLRALCAQAGVQPIEWGTHGVGWRAMGRRRALQYVWRKSVWGREYGRTDAWLVGVVE